jgi:hypothetical protein
MYGFQFDSGLASVALGKAGADCKFNILLQSGPLVGASLHREELGRCFIVDFFQASAAPQTFAAAINSGS